MSLIKTKRKLIFTGVYVGNQTLKGLKRTEKDIVQYLSNILPIDACWMWDSCHCRNNKTVYNKKYQTVTYLFDSYHQTPFSHVSNYIQLCYLQLHIRSFQRWLGEPYDVSQCTDSLPHTSWQVRPQTSALVNYKTKQTRKEIENIHYIYVGHALV